MSFETTKFQCLLYLVQGSLLNVFLTDWLLLWLKTSFSLTSPIKPNTVPLTALRRCDVFVGFKSC